MKNLKFKNVLMVALATTAMLFTSCNNNDDDPKPQPKANVLDSLSGAVENTKGQIESVTIYKGQKDVANNASVLSCGLQVEKSKDGEDQIYLYTGYSSIGDNGKVFSYNMFEKFLKFTPKVTPIEGTSRIKVESKQIKDVLDLTEGKSNNKKEGDDSLVDDTGTIQKYTKVSFEYDTKTHTINTLSIQSTIKGMGIVLDSEENYTNIKLDPTKKVTPFGKSLHKSIEN